MKPFMKNKLDLAILLLNAAIVAQVGSIVLRVIT